MGHREACGRSARPARKLILVLALSTVLASCASTRPASGTAAPSATLPADIAAAIEVRGLYGLRDDEGYVRFVADNPLASKDVLGIPLLPQEVADLKARTANRAQVVSIVEAYGQQHPDSWAGMAVDEAGGGDVVAWFSRELARHKAGILQLTGPLAKLRVEPATWSLAELEEHAKRLRDQRAWFAATGAPLVTADVSVRDNKVVVVVSSADFEAPARIVDRFDGDGWLQVESDGTGPWTGGQGKLEIRVVDAAGNPVRARGEEQWLCVATPDARAAWEGGPGIVGPDGVCRFAEPLGATGYDIEIRQPVGEDIVAIGRGRAEVVADKTTEVTITVQPQ